MKVEQTLQINTIKDTTESFIENEYLLGTQAGFGGIWRLKKLVAPPPSISQAKKFLPALYQPLKKS